MATEILVVMEFYENLIKTEVIMDLNREQKFLHKLEQLEQQSGCHVVCQTIKEAFLALYCDNERYVSEKSVCEGIDIDYVTQKVSYNPNHQYNVDTSIEGNPTVDTELIPGVEVWSIFSRNRSDIRDGNPLVYALKGEGKWQFNDSADRKAIESQFNLIADKFLAKHSYDVTVIAPTTNPLNEYIAKIILSKQPNIEYIRGALLKLSTDDIANMVEDKDSAFVQTYKDNIMSARRLLFAYLERMDRERDGVFTRHLISDNKMRNVLDRTLKNNDDLVAEDAAKITDHDVLIIDDTISRGQIIREAVNIIRSCYAPKSITVLTLFSALK